MSRILIIEDDMDLCELLGSIWQIYFTPFIALPKPETGNREASA